MRIVCALAALLLTLPPAASAAPIQSVLDSRTGFVSFSGLAGEIVILIGLPAEFVVLPPPNAALTYYLNPSPRNAEIGYVWHAGINGTFEFGNVVKPHLSETDFANFRAGYQTSVTSDLVEFPPIFVSHSSAIPSGQAGFFVVIPEPASCSLLVVAAAAAMAVNRRRTGRQRCLAVSS